MGQDTRDENIGAELAKAQHNWVAVTVEYRQARQDIVMRALAVGWTKYRIAKAMGVRAPIVDSIIETATREQHA